MPRSVRRPCAWSVYWIALGVTANVNANVYIHKRRTRNRQGAESNRGPLAAVQARDVADLSPMGLLAQ
jgi:hypothetical protein